MFVVNADFDRQIEREKFHSRCPIDRAKYSAKCATCDSLDGTAAATIPFNLTRKDRHGWNVLITNIMRQRNVRHRVHRDACRTGNSGSLFSSVLSIANKPQFHRVIIARPLTDREIHAATMEVNMRYSSARAPQRTPR